MEASRVLATIAVGCLATACANPDAALDQIAQLYRNEAVMDTRNPVIVIHGILGARLAQRSSGKTAWGAFTSEAIDPSTPEGARVIGLPLAEGTQLARPYDPEKEDVYASGPLEALQVGFFFGTIAVKVYAQIIKSLGVGGYTDPVLVDPKSPRYADDHYTCYTFFYDWRRDCAENAILLGNYIELRRAQIVVNAGRKAKELRASGDPAKVARGEALAAWLQRGFKFDIVAHSMGGLIARYYLLYGKQDLELSGELPDITWAGAKDIDRAILIGTPNLGSMNAFKELHEGSQLSFFAPYYDPGVLGSMPAVYQLLPRPRHTPFVDEDDKPVEVDLYDPAVWEKNGWGLMRPDGDRWLAALRPDLKDAAERRATARGALAWYLIRAQRFHAALDRVPKTPCPAELHLFAADSHPTLARARLVRRDDRLVPSFGGGDVLYERGDETVPRYSAVGDERQGRLFRIGTSTAVAWTSVTFLDDDHVGLTRNPLFTNNLLFTLLERAPPSLRAGS